jgi:hypothetical protein
MKWSSEFLKKKLADGIAGWWKPLVESAIVGLFAFFSYCEIGGIPLWPALVAGILLALSVIGAIVVYRDEKTRPNKIRYRRISKFLARLADQAARSGIIREELVQITAKAQAAIFGGIGEEEGNRLNFSSEVQDRVSSLGAQMVGLERTWRDQEQKKFADEFEQHMRTIARFVEVMEHHIPYLNRKAEIIDEYLQQR